jgi:hypothetical protein
MEVFPSGSKIEGVCPLQNTKSKFLPFQLRKRESEREREREREKERKKREKERKRKRAEN